MSRSQTERVLARLNQGAMCSMEPLDWEPRITRVGARIYDLKAEGHEIVTRPVCAMHAQPGRHALYELVSADQRSLF